MNTMNVKNNLGKVKGRMSKSKNNLGILSVNKNNPRGKGKRRSNLAKSPLPKDRE